MKKKILFLGLIITSLFLVISTTNAHSPSNVVLDYELSTYTLNVVVEHGVSDVNTHYIKKIYIYVNDVLNHTENYTNQTYMTFQDDSFVVPALIGDVIRVTAICNQGGSLTNQITVQDLAVPEFNRSLIFLSFSAILIIGLTFVRKRLTK